MDLKAKLGQAPIPVYRISNVLGRSDIGKHGYDMGNLEREHNGLVYTCRGGFIDVAHIRDNADRTLYLATQFARQLPAGFTVVLPEEGTLRRVLVKPLPQEVLNRYGHWIVASTLAEWVNFQLSVWHEIATWYGWESIRGFSERISAFSLEDLYSNVLGEKLAAGIILSHEIDSRRTYDRAMDAWIQEGLRRLGSVSRTDGRRAMQAVDGLWWDSKQRVPDNRLVLRRSLHIDSPLSPWLVEDALPPGPTREELVSMCKRQPGPLPLAVPERIGDIKIEDLVTIEFGWNSWLPEHFPLPVEKGRTFTQAEFPLIIKDIRTRGKEELGPGFDQPRPVEGSGAPLARAPQ